jgi:hypothetical protein
MSRPEEQVATIARRRRTLLNTTPKDLGTFRLSRGRRTMRKLFAGMIFAALWTGVTVEQNGPIGATPTETTAGPSSSVTGTQQTIDGRGVETNTKET